MEDQFDLSEDFMIDNYCLVSDEHIRAFKRTYTIPLNHKIRIRKGVIFEYKTATDAVNRNVLKTHSFM